MHLFQYRNGTCNPHFLMNDFNIGRIRKFLSQTSSESGPMNNSSNAQPSGTNFITDEELNESFPYDDIIVNVCAKMKSNANELRDRVSKLLGIDIPVPLVHTDFEHFVYHNETPQIPHKTEFSTETTEKSSEERIFDEKDQQIQSSKTNESQNENDESSNDFMQDENHFSESEKGDSIESSTTSSSSLTQQKSPKFLSSTTDSTSLQEDSLYAQYKAQQKQLIAEENKEIEKSEQGSGPNRHETVPPTSLSSQETSQQNKPVIKPSGFKTVKSHSSQFRYPIGYYGQQQNPYSDMRPLDLSQTPQPS